MSWEAAAVKFVLFPATPSLSDASDLWLTAFGKPAQTYNNMPGMLTHVTGRGRTGPATLMTQPGRVELGFVPEQPQGGDLSRPSVIDLDASLIEGAVLSERMLKDVPILRVGLNCEFLQVAASTAAAVSAMTKELALKKVPLTAEDLILQLNVPRRFSIIDHRMNRICKWGTGMVQLVQTVLGGPAGAGMVHAQHAIRTMFLDLSTEAMSATPLEAAKLGGIWGELAEEARLILSIGYDRLT